MREKRLGIVGISAMQAYDEGAMPYAKPTRITSASAFASTASELAVFNALPQGCTYPVHVSVCDDAHRLRTKRWYAFSYKGPFVPGTWLDIGDNRLLISPEEFFLRMATKLSAVQAVLLGMELCGYYSTLMSAPYREYCDGLVRERAIALGERPWPPTEWDMPLEHQRGLMKNGFITRSPLTTPEKLAHHLEQSLSSNRYARVKTLVGLVEKNSHSPMESRLYAWYCLPRRYGGMNLRPVELNAEIELPESIARTVGFERYSVDLYWPTAKRAIEYEGSSAHSGLTAVQKDRLKRNILEATGIRIISIDKEQFADEDVMNLYGEQIAGGLKVRPSKLALQPREYAARRALLDEINNWDCDLYRL